MTNGSPVLMVGGTGMLGGQVVAALLSRGKRVRALVRPASNAAALERAGVEIARGDLSALLYERTSGHAKYRFGEHITELE